MVDEAKNESTDNTEDLGVDSQLDKVLDEYEKENSGQDSSPDEKTTENPENKSEDGSDPDTEKKVSEDEKEGKTEDEEIPKEFHKHKAWQRLLARAKSAEAKLQEIEKTGGLDSETKTLLDEFKNFTSSKKYLEDKLKAEGFRDDVIKKKLDDAGFKDDSINELEIATKALGLSLDKLTDQDKTDITNLAKIADALMMSRLQKILPETLNPLKETVSKITQKEQGQKIYDDFAKKVQEDGILDMSKDLAPDIAKYLDENEKKGITQDDVKSFIEDLYHRKLVLYKKASTKKEERHNEAKGNRPGGEGSKFASGIPKKTGNLDKDADAFLDHIGIK